MRERSTDNEISTSVSDDRRNFRSQSDSRIVDELDRVLALSPRPSHPLSPRSPQSVPQSVNASMARDALSGSVHGRPLDGMGRSQHGMGRSQHGVGIRVGIDRRPRPPGDLLDELDKTDKSIRSKKGPSPPREGHPNGEAHGEDAGTDESVDRFARLVNGIPRKTSVLGTSINGRSAVDMEYKLDKLSLSLHLDPACIRHSSKLSPRTASDLADGSGFPNHSEHHRRRPSYMETTRSSNKKFGPDK